MRALIRSLTGDCTAKRAERPIDRFQPDALRCLPVITPDYRDTVEALVHKDMRLQLDRQSLLRAASASSRPPSHTGKADSSSHDHDLRTGDRDRQLCAFVASWGQTFGAGRFEAELAEVPACRPAVARPRSWLFAAFSTDSCSPVALEAYLLATSPIAIAPCRARSRNYWNSFVSTVPTPWLGRHRKRLLAHGGAFGARLRSRNILCGSSSVPLPGAAGRLRLRDPAVERISHRSTIAAGLRRLHSFI